MKYKFRLSLGWLTLSVMLAGLLAACGDSTATPVPAATTAAPAATTAAAAMTTAPAATTAAPALTTAAATTAAGVATTAPAANTTGGNTTGVTDTEVVIGSWGPQSGPAASYGIIDRAIDAYMKKVNAEGGVNGRKIKFIYQDDAYNPAQTQAVVKKLAEQDKVFAFVSGLGTANNLAVMDYLVSNNIPHVAPSTGSTSMSKPLKKNVFALQTNYTVEAILLTRYAVDSLNAKKVAIFYQDDAFGKEGLEAAQSTVKAKGQTVAGAVSYQTTDKDFGSQALKLQQSGADTVILWGLAAPIGSLLKEMDKIGYKPQIVQTSVASDNSIFKLSDGTVDGAWTASWLPDITDPATKDPKVLVFRDFMSKYMAGENQLSGNASSGLAQAQLLVEGLKRAGKDLTREKFIAAMESIQNWNDSILFNVSYGPDNRQGQNAVYFLQASAKENRFIKKTDYIEYKPS